MSWRALIIGDVHYRATNPIARLDNFQEALNAKLRECWRLAEDNDADVIIQTGDLFHSPGIVYTTLADLIHLLGRAPAPIYTVPGNHDLFAAHPDSLYRTPLGFLFQLGVVDNAERMGGYIRPQTHVWISGRGYDASTDIELSTYLPNLTKEPLPRNVHGDPVIVHVAHGMLVQNPVPGRHTLISDLAHLPNAPDVLVNGHFHLGTGIHRVGKTLVVNPGALCRLSAHVEEIDRPVQVALLTVDGHNYDAELITLESARPGEDVLSREHLVAQAERERRRDEFLDLLASEETQKTLDLVEMVQSIAGREKLADPVRDEALRRISVAEEAMVG